MADETLIARDDDNILRDATVSDGSPTAVMDSYSLETLLLGEPDARVRFTESSIAVTFTLPTPRRGDVFVLPVHNLDASDGGSPASVLRLTNGAGLDVLVPVPAMRANGIPRSVAIDLTDEVPNAVTRTSDTWTVSVDGNSVDVIFGGAIYLFAEKRVLHPDLRWGFTLAVQHAVTETKNQYLKRYRVNHRTQEELLDASVMTNDTASLRDLFDANFGAGLPGLLWPQLDNHDAYIGTWDGVFEQTNVPARLDYDLVRLRFAVLSKGKPVV